MSKMTKRELDKRKAELKKMVHAEMVKREVMQFRLEPDNIDKLYQIAMKKRKPVGTLVREWVIDKINAELGTEANQTFMVRPEDVTFNAALGKLKSDLQGPLNEIVTRMAAFEATAKKLERSQKKRLSD